MSKEEDSLMKLKESIYVADFMFKELMKLIPKTMQDREIIAEKLISLAGFGIDKDAATKEIKKIIGDIDE